MIHNVPPAPGSLFPAAVGARATVRRAALSGRARPRAITVAAPASAPTAIAAPPPPKTAHDFERNLQNMATAMGASIGVAAMHYLDIAHAVERSGMVERPGRWLRYRRRWAAGRGLWGRFGPSAFKHSFAEALRCTSEAALRYYGIAPASVGLPSAQDMLTLGPAVTCARAAAALEQGRAAMALVEFAHLPHTSARAAPGCTCRASFDSATAQLTVYIDWFNGPRETSGVHHCVPLFVATRHRGHRFRFVSSTVNDLPKTAQARGYAPFRYTAEKVLEPLPTRPMA